MLTFLILMTIISPIITYRLCVATNYAAHKRFVTTTPVVKPLHPIDWIIVVLSVWPGGVIGFLVGSMVGSKFIWKMPLCEYFWATIHAKVGQKYYEYDKGQDTSKRIA